MRSLLQDNYTKHCIKLLLGFFFLTLVQASSVVLNNRAMSILLFFVHGRSMGALGWGWDRQKGKGCRG